MLSPVFSSGLGVAAYAFAFALLLAFYLDIRMGEPPSRVHPVVGMGNLLHLLAKPLQGWQRPDTADQQRIVPFILGMLMWMVAAALVVAVAWAVQWAILHNPALPWWGNACLLAIVLKPLFAWRMLREQVALVETALADGLDAGKQQLSQLVSRDTTQLTATDVREAALETLAENLNDSLVSPLLWFAMGGLPAAALYRLANTADAMWGYHGIRNGKNWEWAGKWAAWADDAMSWLGARITAVLLMLLSGAAWRRSHWRTLWHGARSTPSPNGGLPMTALAIALGCRLCKPASSAASTATSSLASTQETKATKAEKGKQAPTSSTSSTSSTSTTASAVASACVSIPASAYLYQLNPDGAAATTTHTTRALRLCGAAAWTGVLALTLIIVIANYNSNAANAGLAGFTGVSI